MYLAIYIDTIPCMGSVIVDLRHRCDPLSHNIKLEIQIQRQRKGIFRSRSNPIADPKSLDAFTLAHHCFDVYIFPYFSDFALKVI